MCPCCYTVQTFSNYPVGLSLLNIMSSLVGHLDASLTITHKFYLSHIILLPFFRSFCFKYHTFPNAFHNIIGNISHHLLICVFISCVARRWSSFHVGVGASAMKHFMQHSARCRALSLRSSLHKKDLWRGFFLQVIMQQRNKLIIKQRIGN